MKTKEELIELKTEFEMLGKKLRELSVDELAQVTGGVVKIPDYGACPSKVLVDGICQNIGEKNYCDTCPYRH